jgi:hypothetical protein
VSTYDDLIYKIGRNAVTTVIKRGRVYAAVTDGGR